MYNRSERKFDLTTNLGNTYNMVLTCQWVVGMNTALFLFSLCAEGDDIHREKE